MKILAYESFHPCYHRLPRHIQRKTDKQLRLLAADFRHPSLHTKRVQGTHGIWEARVDRQYRMTFELVEDTLVLRVVGNHDEVLRNP